MDARPTLVALAFLLAVACAPEEELRPAPAALDAAARDAQGHTPPTPTTVASNAAVAESLALDDPQDFEDARRGLVASEPQVVIEADDGRKLWDTRDYEHRRFRVGSGSTSGYGRYGTFPRGPWAARCSRLLSLRRVLHTKCSQGASCSRVHAPAGVASRQLELVKKRAIVLVPANFKTAVQLQAMRTRRRLESPNC
jgi:hypothetical protein